MKTRTTLLCLGIVLLAGCNSPNRDADRNRFGSGPIRATDITGGAKGVAGTRYRADVQIGHSVGQTRSQGTSLVVEGNAAVKP